MKTVPLSGPKGAGRVALVDDADYDLVMQYKWYLLEEKRRGRPRGPYAYARPWRDGKQSNIYMHKLLTGWPRTDHIDHDGLNNQRSNLRPATSRQNAWNMRPLTGCKSRFKGVSWHTVAETWTAHIKVNDRTFQLGWFHLEEAAAWAYDEAARENFGEYACPNFQSPGDPLGLKAAPILDVIPPGRPPADVVARANRAAWAREYRRRKRTASELPSAS